MAQTKQIQIISANLPQSDWNQTDETKLDYIKNKPVIKEVIPHIGENGNWFIGEVDTGKSAKGIQGEKGDTGDKGDKGNIGDSAYNVAQQYGFKGTPVEWIESLRGDSGVVCSTEEPTGSSHPVWINPGDSYPEKEDLIPIKGVDYWTDEEKEEILTELARRVGLYDLTIFIDGLQKFYQDYDPGDSNVI